ncbi:MAG: YceI family protein [Ginsengibacter sp.]
MYSNGIIFAIQNLKIYNMAKWTVDPAHSEIHFKIKHLVISTVSGSFKTFSGEVESDKEDFTDAKVTGRIEVNSISTNQEQRDAHLKSADFFDAENYPEITFQSKSLSKEGTNYKLTGDLTIRGISKQVTFDVEFGGGALDLYGQTKAGFDVTGKINRQDFGLKWSALTEAGGLVVSDEVKIEMSIQLTKQV